MTLPAKAGEEVTLAMVLENGTTGLYPQAEVYYGASLEDTIDLADLGQGRYEGGWTPGTAGVFTTLFNVYQDASHTVQLTPLIYSRELEQIVVSSSTTDDLALSIARILGLVHENAFIDNTEFNANGELTAARVRLFNTKADVNAATDGGTGEGEFVTYTIASDYEAPGKMKTYKMVRD